MILDRYISSNFLKDSIIIVFSICFVAILTRIVQYSEVVFGGGASGFYRIFLIFALIFPKIFSVIVPFGLGFATFFLLNKLTLSSELVAISSVGYRKIRIVEIFFLISFVFFTINTLFTFFVIPYSYKQINKIEKEFNNEIITNLIKNSTFSFYGDYIFYIDSNNLEDIKNVNDERSSSFVRIFAMQSLDCIRDDIICANIVYSANGNLNVGAGIVNANLKNAFVRKKLPIDGEDFYSNGVFNRFNFQMSLLNVNTRNNTNPSELSILELIELDPFSKKSGIMQEIVERLTSPFLTIFLPLVVAVSFLAFVVSSRSKNGFSMIKIATVSTACCVLLFLPMLLKITPVWKIILFCLIICLIIIFLFLIGKRIK